MIITIGINYYPKQCTFNRMAQITNDPDQELLGSRIPQIKKASL